MIIRCPNCNRKLRTPETNAGKKAVCPSCRERLVIPQIESVAVVSRGSVMNVILSIIVVGVLAAVSFIVINRIPATQKENPLKQEEAQKNIEEGQIGQAEPRKLEIQKEAEKAKILAEKVMQAEEERIRTYPARLAAAENEVADANSGYAPLAAKVREMKKKIAILQAQWETLDEKANAAERQERNSKTLQIKQTEQAGQAGQTRIVRNKTSALRQTRAVENKIRETQMREQTHRGLSSKASQARAEAERKKVALDLLKGEFNEAQQKLREAETILRAKKDALKVIKTEKV